MRVSLRNALLACTVLGLAAATASAGAASVRHRTHRGSQVRTYSTRGTAPLATALDDPWLFNNRGAHTETAFAMTRSAGATYVRLPANWSAIAPSTRPPGFVATDPTSPGYSWAALDANVAAADAAGLTPILDLQSVPQWAYAKRPQGVNAGTPKASALGQFAAALATHYDGVTPSAHVFEVWNEPNVSIYLSPVSGSAYRGMVNAVADAVHAVDSKNIVVAGNLDPFGHPKSKKQKWNSVHPLAFMRSVFCVSKGKHPHRTCHATVHFDAWSHHPYTFNGPFGHARNSDDVTLGDLPRMRSLLRAGVRLHHVISRHPVKFWVTEFSWDTNPPRRHAAPTGLAARWTEEAFYQMWRSGVSLVTWFGLQDRGGKSPYQSGLFRHSASLEGAKAKPVRTAFRFPFVAYLKGGTVGTWGRDATSDQRLVTIQRRHGAHGHWKTVAKIRSNRLGILKANLKLEATKKDWLRATASGSGTSLPFSLTRPSPKLRYGPWGN
ncbi:MAG TPA: cellulase family glycosylhydrolase [Gaiellaceae bacterium]|nr:cellulase family glycosylhydrolase [Gaiellaceae bacterium]